MKSADEKAADLAAAHQREIDGDEKGQLQVAEELEKTRDVNLEKDGGYGDGEQNPRPETRDLLELVAHQIRSPYSVIVGNLLRVGEGVSRRGGDSSNGLALGCRGGAARPLGLAPARPLSRCRLRVPAGREFQIEVRRFRTGSALSEFVVLGRSDLLVRWQQPVGIGADAAGQGVGSVHRNRTGAASPDRPGRWPAALPGWPDARLRS